MCISEATASQKCQYERQSAWFVLWRIHQFVRINSYCSVNAFLQTRLIEKLDQQLNSRIQKKL